MTTQAFDQETGEIADTLPAPPMSSFRMSGEMGPLFKAKAMARADFLPIVKDKTVKVSNKEGKHLYNFVYADLGTVIAATERGLATNGLDLMWFLSDAVDGKTLRCILAHESGSFIESCITIPPGDSPQELGSALTYARRYQAQCVLGVAPEDDDDGSAAGGKVAIPVEKPQAARPEPRREAPAPQPKSEPKAPPAPAQAALPVAPANTETLALASQITDAHARDRVAAPPITPSATKTLVDPGTREPVQDETGAQISAHFKAMNITAATEKTTLCKTVTGVMPKELDEAAAQRFLAYLKIEAAQRGVSVAV